MRRLFLIAAFLGLLAPAAWAGSPVTINDKTNLYSACVNSDGTLCVNVTPSTGPTAGIAPVVSGAAEACHVLKASAGNLYSVSGFIGAAGYIMVFNATSAPGDGAVTPAVWAYANAQGSWSISYGSVPAYFSTGITVCASSTGPLTKTAYSANTVFSGNVK